LRREWTEQLLNRSGKIPDDNNRLDNDGLMIFVIVGRRTEAHCLRSEAGTKSRSHSIAEN
jgi:hypothetical protein